MREVPRGEYPRPRLRRERWHNLNGTWSFAFDDADRGTAQRWFAAGAGGAPFDRQITVPFCYQAPLSGIGDTARHDVVWYARGFDDVRADPGQRLLLHVGAADYRTTVWVNGQRLTQHEGGHTPFAVDVTDALADAGNAVVLRVEDRLDDLEQPRGKQYWGDRPTGVFYTPTTGVWQTVWLEPVGATHVSELQATPDLDRGEVEVEVALSQPRPGAQLRVRVSLEGLVLVDDVVGAGGRRVRRRWSVVPPAAAAGARAADWQGIATWSPRLPALHDVHVDVLDGDGRVLDRVTSYVGMRKVSLRDGQVLLNDRPLRQRLVLDQGYWPDGLLTAPSDADLRRDIELARELGFDGARKHQKIEDPRWLYWADRLGFLVWAEAPSAFRFSPDMVTRLLAEWQAAVRRDRSHPCVVAWVPLNESWGVPELGGDARQRALVLALRHATRSLDCSRPVVSNDGWEQAETDLLTIHDYGDPDELRARYGTLDATLRARPNGKPLFLDGHGHHGQPVLVSECGGIAVEGGDGTCGYHTVPDGDALVERYAELVAALDASPHLAGFCYTQLTDVEQETNGLLTADRKPKADPAAVARATRGDHPLRTGPAGAPPKEPNRVPPPSASRRPTA